jgi:hypothetical protein
MTSLFLEDKRLELKETSNEKIELLSNFSIKSQDGVKALSEKAKWYIDNESIFLGTNIGDVIHFS